MKCPNEGSIQAYIDGELDRAEIKELEMHLFQCGKCKEIYKELNSVDSFAMGKLQAYEKEFNLKHTKTDYIEVKNKKGVFKGMKKYKNIAAAACAVIVLTTCITVQPIRAAVINAVSIFRADDIKSIDISLEDIRELREALEEHKSDIDINKVGKINFQGGVNNNVTLDEAKAALPFTVFVPENMQPESVNNVFIETPSKIDFTLNVENINRVLKSLGGKKSFPADLDGKTFSLNTAGLFNIRYKLNEDNDYIYIRESKIPELLAPAEANVDEIFNALSELSVLPSNIQMQLKTMKDWKNTLYMPNAGNKPEELNINGMKALGYFMDKNGIKNSSVVILKDGVIININGNVDKEKMVDIAKSLR